MRAAVAGLAERCGRLDVLVNNAAWVRYQAVPDIAPETVERMLEVGFKSVIWGIQAAAEVMDAERGGSIVNIASVAGLRSAPNSIVYSGVKAGVMGITRAAAAELGGARHPGERHRALRGADGGHAAQPQRRAGREAHRADAAGEARHGGGHRPRHRLPRHDQASFVTGQVLVVDGGVTTTTL